MQFQSNVCLTVIDINNIAVKMQVQQQQNSKSLLIKIVLPLEEDSLVTHCVIKSTDGKPLHLHNAEILETLDDGNQAYSKLLQQSEQEFRISGVGVGSKLRLSFQHFENDARMAEQKFKTKIQSVAIYGYQIQQCPSASAMVCLLNINELFKRNGKEQAQVEVLLGLSLLSSRRFIQASEIFKRVAQGYADKGGSKFEQASNLQLLVADSINQPSMINDKLHALKLAILYYNHTYLALQEDGLYTLNNADTYECLLRLSTDLLRVLSTVLLTQILEPLKMAALRLLEFLLEQIGISLGPAIIQIVKLIHKVLQRQQTDQSLEMINKIIAIIIQELNQASLTLIQELWEQVIITALSDANSEAQKIILRIAEHLLSIEQVSLRIDIPFLKQLNSLNEDKIWNLVVFQAIPKLNNKKLQKIVIWVNSYLNELLNFTSYASLMQAQQKNIMKCLILLDGISRTIKEDHQLPLFDQCMYKQLEANPKLCTLYYKPTLSLIQLKPILIRILDQSVNNRIHIDCFQQVWDLLIKILIEDNDQQQLFEITQPFLDNIFRLCHTCSPTQPILVILLHILSTIDSKAFDIITKFDTLYGFLEIFTTRVPHSIYDETFKIFDLLLKFNYENLDYSLIEKSILALVDQYTVKGQAQKLSKTQLIKLCILNNQILDAIQICLMENLEPVLYVNYQQNPDNKQLMQEYEIFLEKLQFATEIFADISVQFKQIPQLLNTQKSFSTSIINLLQSRNSRVRLKTQNILQSMIEGYIQLDSSTRLKLFDDQFLFLEWLSPMVTYSLQDKQDTRCVLSSLSMLNSIFQLKLQKSDSLRSLQLIMNTWPLISDMVGTSFNGIQTLIFEILNTWSQLLNKMHHCQQYNIFIEQLFLWATEQLQSRESWHQYNILKLCGYIFGLDVGINFREFDVIPAAFWESVYQLQMDKNKQLQLMAIVIVQLCAPKQQILKLHQTSQEQFNLYQHKVNKQREQINRQSEELIHSLFLKQSYSRELQSETFGSSSVEESDLNVDDLLWMKRIDSDQLQQYLQTLFTYQQQQESKLKQSDIQEVSIKNNQTQPQKNILDDDPLDFDELGIIEVDDEEWNEYDDLRKIPVLKAKIKTISPQTQQKRPNQERRPSGNRQRQQNERNEDQLLNTLRPHNQVFRPLTPPIGQQTYQSTNQMQSNMQIISDYMLQDPQGFQKLIEDIKVNNLQQEIEIKEEVQFQQRSPQQAPPSVDQTNQPNLEVRRRVDELEFDPQFSNSSQEDGEEPISSKFNKQQSPQISNSVKKAKNKKLNPNRVSSDNLKVKKSSDEKVKVKKNKSKKM